MPVIKQPVKPVEQTPGQSNSARSKFKKAIAVAVTILVLVLVLVFVWRVVYFVDLIQTGEINALDMRYAGQQSTSLLALSTAEQGADIDVVSADDPYLGSREAKVTIVEFADFACPYCRQSSFVMRSLSANYGDQIQYIFRDFPVADLYPQSLAAAQAASCANQQGKFWQYHDKLFINQTRQEETDLLRYAQELNLDLGRFRTCLADSAVEREIMADFEDGTAAGVYGTPTFFINGRRLPGSLPESYLVNIINSLLAQ